MPPYMIYMAAFNIMRPSFIVNVIFVIFFMLLASYYGVVYREEYTPVLTTGDLPPDLASVATNFHNNRQ